MNNILNVKRFGLVLRKDFQENWKRYLLQFLTMFGIILLVLSFASDDRYRYIERGHYSEADVTLLGFSSFMFMAFGCIFASTMMEPMRNKTRRISYLMNPGSNFEKFFSRWLIVSVVFVFSFFIALWLADVIRVFIFSIKYPVVDVHMIDFTRLISDNTHSGRYLFENKSLFGLGLGIYMLLQSLFVLGAAFWEKGTFVKTFSAGLIIVLLFFLLCRWVILISYHDFNAFGNVVHSFMHDIRENTQLLVIQCILILFALANWVIAFFRFRESEIIKRL